MLISVRVDRVTLDPTSNRFIVILRDDENHRWLPIVVGSNEAQAIALQLEGIIPPRPMTHDLIRNLLDALNTHVVRVIVNDLRESTYFAVISMKTDGKNQEIDSRPSDAIALALRMHAPILVDEKVMKRAAVSEKVNDEEAEEENDFDRLENLNIELQRAIKDERFEDAARLRDEIQDIKNERHENN